MEFKAFFITNKDGKSNCVVRSLCKILNKNYEEVYNDLYLIAKEMNKSFNEIEVFENYMLKNNILFLNDEEIKIKDLELDNGKYIVFCYDKNNYYHMVSIINNTLYDKDNKSLELYVIKIYKLR